MPVSLSVVRTSIYMHAPLAFYPPFLPLSLGLYLAVQTPVLHTGSDASLARFASTPPPKPKNVTKPAQERLRMRRSSPLHDEAFVSDVIYGDRLHVSVSVSSPGLDTDSKDKLALALNKVLTKSWPPSKVKALAPDAQVQGFMTWTDMSEVCEAWLNDQLVYWYLVVLNGVWCCEGRVRLQDDCLELLYVLG